MTEGRRIGLASAKGSPGSTTLSLGLGLAAARVGRQVLVVEADASGGSLQARLGLEPGPGLLSLAAAGRHGITAKLLAEHLRPLRPGLAVLVAPSDPRQVRASLDSLGAALADAFGHLSAEGTDVVIDLGRLGVEPAPPLAAGLDQVIWATPPTLDGADALAVRLGPSGLAPCSAVLTVGDGPYAPEEIAGVLALCLIGALPADPTGAGRLWAGLDAQMLWRSPLGRGLGRLADAILPTRPVAEAVRTRRATRRLAEAVAP